MVAVITWQINRIKYVLYAFEFQFDTHTHIHSIFVTIANDACTIGIVGYVES